METFVFISIYFLIFNGNKEIWILNSNLYLTETQIYEMLKLWAILNLWKFSWFVNIDPPVNSDNLLFFINLHQDVWQSICTNFVSNKNNRWDFLHACIKVTPTANTTLTKRRLKISSIDFSVLSFSWNISVARKLKTLRSV